MKIAESSLNGWKTLWVTEKLLDTSNFSFSHSVFKKLVSQGRQKVSLCGNGLILFLLTTVPCFDSGYVGKQPVAWKEYCEEYWLKEVQESMDRCTGRCDITEILLKTTLNTMQ